MVLGKQEPARHGVMGSNNPKVVWEANAEKGIEP